MTKSKEEKALENLKILQEVDLISRREFLSVASLLGSATVVANLMTPQSALAWVATRMRKGRASSDPYAAIDVGDIGHSLRFRSSASAYLARTPGSTNNRTTWTWSAWVKPGVNTADALLFASGADANNRTAIMLATGSIPQIGDLNGGSIIVNKLASQVLRDHSSFYHIVFAFDTTNASAEDRVRMYINGVRVTSFTTNTVPSQNYAGWINTNNTHYISRRSESTAGNFDGYLSRICFVDGQALTPSSFGYLNPNSNSWVTKSQSIIKSVVDSGGTNSFMLDFDDGTSTATLGYDKSSKANNWTATNISLTAGATYDWILDTPSNNFCTLNPLDKDRNQGTISNGNLYWTTLYSDNVAPIRSSMAVPANGKWFFEFSNLTASGGGNGATVYLTQSTQDLTSNSAWSENLTPFIGVYADVYSNYILFKTSGMSASLAHSTSLWASCVSGDRIKVAVDFTAGKIWIAKNDIYYNSGDPVAGTNPTSTFTVGSLPYFVGADVLSSSDNVNRSSVSINFGQQPLTTPTGFKSLCTANLTKPTIANPKKHFDVVARSGNSGSYSVTGLGFTPDFFWTKCRNTGLHHYNVDSVRGNDNVLSSSTTGAENSEAAYITSTAADGYTLGAGVNVVNYNGAGNTYVDWLWKAGGAAVSNSAGTITSQVSANTTAGFSIVTGTYPSAPCSVGHGLGTTPSMVIARRRTVVDNWFVWHKSLSSSTQNYLCLNTISAFANSATIWNNTAPSTTVFNLGGGFGTGNDPFVLYCFAEISGFSKFGSYTGNGLIDGPFVWCGFRPKYILIKRIDAGAGWFIRDAARDSFNPLKSTLESDQAFSEASFASNELDLLSNGFKIRQDNSFGYHNASGAIYIFIAFAEAPFKYANAR